MTKMNIVQDLLCHIKAVNITNVAHWKALAPLVQSVTIRPILLQLNSGAKLIWIFPYESNRNSRNSSIQPLVLTKQLHNLRLRKMPNEIITLQLGQCGNPSLYFIGFFTVAWSYCRCWLKHSRFRVLEETLCRFGTAEHGKILKESWKIFPPKE
jgi:hypothetical protein